MQQRKLGNVGISVPAIGLGCMGMSEFYRASDEAQNFATLDAALEHDTGFLDTADMYGLGANEELLGRFLVGRRNRITIATKFGILRSDDPDARPVDTSPAYVRTACEASLRRLGVETIDLYYMHRRNVEVPIEDTVGAMAQLVQEGKIRAIGLCEVAPETIRRAHATHPVSAIQSEYSLWSRDVEEDVLPVARQLGIGFVAYSPLGRGALAGALRSSHDLSENDFRRTIPRYAPNVLAHNMATVDRLRLVAKRRNATLAQTALAWLLAQDDHLVAIPGSRSPERLIENAAARDLKLDTEEIAEISAIFARGKIEGSRTTTAGERLINL